MLNIQHLTKIYGGKKAVDDLSLHIRPGEIYGFIGHNGAGKTTTLKSCCGILQFDSGDILVDGVSIRVHDRHPVPELHRGRVRGAGGGAGRADPPLWRRL